MSTVQQLITQTRRFLQDPSGEELVDDGWITDDSNLLWSNAELVDYLNEAEREACRRSFLLLESEDTDIIRISVEEDTAVYALNPLILEVLSGTLTTAKRVLSVEQPLEYFQSISGSWNTLTGIPTAIITDYQTGKIRLYKIPVEDDTLMLTAYRLPKTEMTWANRSSSPEIDSSYHMDLIWWILYLAFSKYDSETEDTKMADRYYNLFASAFGPRVDAYSKVQKAKRHKKVTSYGGIYF